MSSYDGPIKRQRMNEKNSEDRNDDRRPFNDDMDQPNKVLLYTILNAVYPITTDVVHKISEPHGDVKRIVIFRKRGVQAMVEFSNVQDAQCAKATLNGADIYSGCCTLKINWAKPTRLNVYKNDDETWDYTVDLRGGSQPALLGDAPAGFNNQFNQGMNTRVGTGGMRGNNRGRNNDMMMMRGPRMNEMMNQSGDFNDSMNGQDGGGVYSSSPVLMIYGLNAEKMNCDRLFNILCLYGNVFKVKFLKTKVGTAMVQMGDPSAVDRCISGLSGMRFFDEKLTLAPSKQMMMYLTNDNSGNQNNLPDGSPSQMDYNSSRNNRFTTTEQAAKNRIQNPSKVLHYYNVPVSFDEEAVKKICEELGISPPIKFVPFKSKTERSSSGLMEFENKARALECLAVANHYKIENTGTSRYPYIVKLCFSTSSTSSY